MVFDDEEAREQLEGQRGGGEEIASDDHLAVVGEEGRPAGGGIAAAWHAAQIPGDAAFGDGEAELQEFPMDPGRAPIRILRRQATDQGPTLLADSRPAPALSGSPAPVEAKAGSMPPDRTTVCGFTMSSTSDHRGHRRRSAVQKKRSSRANVAGGRCGWRRRVSVRGA